MSSRLVSVVMPAYNCERYIGQAIESVLAQTYSRVELIVVDDGSTDGTAAVARSYGDRLRYVYQENQRQAAARNLGIRLAHGELIALLDADDVWLPEKLTRQVGFWEKNPSLGLVYCMAREIDEEGRPLLERSANLRGDCLHDVLMGAGEGILAGSTALIPRTVFEALGEFDPELPPCEDSDFVWRVVSRYHIDFVPEPLILYRLHASNSHKNMERAARGWGKIYRKAFRDERIRRLGWSTRWRARSRIEYMLSGLYFHAGMRWRALGHGLLSVAWWPPALARLVCRSTRQLLVTVGVR